MKTKIIEMFRTKGILNKNNGRKYCYRNYWDEECESLWKDYIVHYRSEDEAWYCLSKGIEPEKCPLCNNLRKFVGGKRGYRITCENCSPNRVPIKKEHYFNSIKNRTEEDLEEIKKKRRKTNLEKYGEENYGLYGSESFKNKMLNKYGDKYYSNYEKAKLTNLERYGVDCNFKKKGFVEYSLNKKRELYGNASNYEKTKITNMERYGVEHIGKCREIIEKTIESKQLKYDEFELKNNCIARVKLKEKYGQGWYALGLDYIEYMGHYFVPNEYLEIIEEYFNEGTHTNNYISNRENELKTFIRSIYKGTICENVTNIVKNHNHRFFELDIYLPELKIAFEFDGIYWHSTKFKDKYYHQRKTICGLEQGVRIAHIQEDEWVNNRDEVCEKIRQLIFEDKDFNDGSFPPKIYEGKFSEPRKIMIDKYGKKTLDESECKLVYYDVGVII